MRNYDLDMSGSSVIGTRDARAIWRQGRIPVVFRPAEFGLMVRLPDHFDSEHWLRGGRTRRPEWIDLYKCWDVPRAWFSDVVRQCLSGFGQVYVIQPLNESQKCSPACSNAEGEECECSCLGANHGTQRATGQWYVVREAVAVQWQGRKFGCRLLVEPGRGG